jgi:hypothetical protein
MAKIFWSMLKAPAALVANAAILIGISYPIVWIVGIPNLYVPQIAEPNQILAYTFLSVMGFSLYIASLNIQEDDSGSSEDSGKSDESGNSDIASLTEAPRLIFKVLASITMILLFPISGVIFGVLISTYVSPLIGIVVAIWYPAFDLWLYMKIGRPITPVTLAVIPLYVVVAVWTAIILAITLILGLAIGTPLAGIETANEFLSDDGDLSLAGLELRQPPTQ